MEIVRYDSDRESLFIRYNTNAVWRYSNISKDTYDKIQESESPRDFIRKLFHNYEIVGVVKEDL